MITSNEELIQAVTITIEISTNVDTNCGPVLVSKGAGDGTGKCGNVGVTIVWITASS